MRVTVDADICTACGLCEDICPEVFQLTDEVALVKADPAPQDSEDACREAAETCPVEAIDLD